MSAEYPDSVGSWRVDGPITRDGTFVMREAASDRIVDVSLIMLPPRDDRPDEIDAEFRIEGYKRKAVAA